MGIKDSSGDLAELGRILGSTPEEFVVLVGSAPVFYPALCLGAEGGVLAAACPLPELCVAVYEAHQRGDHASALAGQTALTRVARLVTSVYGIGGLKAALDHLGYYGGPPRAPLPEAGPEAARTVAEALDALGPVATSSRRP